MANPGKHFEEDFAKSLKINNEISLQRLYDVTGGRAGIHYHCDFILYKYPYEYHIELKSTKETRLNFNYISDGQYAGLLEKSKVKGVYAGVLINYRSVDETYFVPITTIRLLRDLGVKSISYQEARNYGIQLEGTKRRVRFNYDIDKLLTEIPKGVGQTWEQKKENYELSKEK